jgi:hypothetical protein
MTAECSQRVPILFRSRCYRAKRGCGFVGCAGHIVKVAAQGFQRIPLLFNLVSCTKTQPPKDWNRRAPSLDRMLKKEGRYQGWKNKPAAVRGCPECNARKRESGSVRFDGSLDIPLVVQLP